MNTASLSRRELLPCPGGAALVLGARNVVIGPPAAPAGMSRMEAARAMAPVLHRIGPPCPQSVGYQGWINVEQDFTTMTPRESCRTSLGYVHDVLGRIYS